MNQNIRILECDFAFKCPKQWENLTVLDDPDKQFCASCEREVFFTRSRQELEINQKLGRCIAALVENPVAQRGIVITGGAVPFDEDVSPSSPNTKLLVLGTEDDRTELVAVLNRIKKEKRKNARKTPRKL